MCLSCPFSSFRDIAMQSSPCILRNMHEGRNGGIEGDHGGQAGINRRQFMLRAGIASAVAWTAPQILSATPASAAVGSAPPSREPDAPKPHVLHTVEEPVTPPSNGLAETITKPATTSEAAPAATTPSRTSKLPTTGTNAQLMAEWAAGLVAVGGALVVGGRARPVEQPATDPAAPPPAD